MAAKKNPHTSAKVTKKISAKPAKKAALIKRPTVARAPTAGTRTTNVALPRVHLAFPKGLLPVTRPNPAQLKGMAEVMRGATSLTLSENGGRSFTITGDSLDAVRQVIDAMGTGPLTLLVGDPDPALTSQQAADILNVSRPHLIKLAREGTLAHTVVGNRHRFQLNDVLEYEAQRRVVRDEALREMTPDGGYSAEDF